jgi:hypothetical protein
MAGRVAVTSRPHTPWAKALIVGGAVVTLVSAVVGFLWLQRMPELQPVDFGEQVKITSTATTSATIYASTGLSRAPSCEVSIGDGASVAVGEAERYLQEGGLESAFGFPVASGTTYTVTCASATEAGRFAVAQDAAVPEGAFMAAGLLGLVVCGTGAVLVARQPR